MRKVLSCLIVASCFWPATQTQAAVIERIVAIVNDEIITQTDMQKYRERLRSGGLTDDLLVPDETIKQELLNNSDRLLKTMIDEKIIASEVKRQNVSVPIEQVEQEIRQIAKQNNLSRDQLKAALLERGVSFSQYQDFIKSGIERRNLIDKGIVSRIKISEDDVIASFAATHKDVNTQAFEYTISHILFLSAGKAGPQGARERADQVLKKLRDGGDFDKLAAEFSEDPNFEQGGLLGSFKSGELNRELEQVVQKLDTGEFSGVVPARDGFHIIKVNKKKLIADPRIEKEREKIRAALYERAYKKQLASWLEQLRQDAFIRINGK